MKWILASASPRRKELLEKMGLAFTVVPACGEEQIQPSKPEDTVMKLSAQKAKEIAEKLRFALPDKPYDEPLAVIGADTVVSYAGEILGKPKDEKDAYRMLSMLQGKCHKVYTGVTVVILSKDLTKTHSFFEETKVVMHPMEEAELSWYIGTGEPFDKAGAYGIQGRCSLFIKEIRGDYDNVVGLPVARLYQELKALGLAVLEDI